MPNAPNAIFAGDILIVIYCGLLGPGFVWRQLADALDADN